jgi:Flagellar hook-length control protein FliK
MTAASAAASAAAPIAPAPSRVASQPSADRFGFAAVLDSLPGATGTADASAAEEQAHRSNESPQEQPPGQTARHSLPSDSALMASLPFALRAAAMMDQQPQAADDSPSLASPAVKGPKSENSGASPAAEANATVGRLTGERAFHLGLSTSAGTLASRALGNDAPFAPAAASFSGADVNGDSASVAGFSRAKAMAAAPLAGAVPSLTGAAAPAPAAPRAGSPSTSRVSAARAASHEAARSGRKPEVSAAPPVARASGSASPPAPAGSSAKAADGAEPDPTLFAAPSTPQSSAFGAQPSAPFVAGLALALDGSTTGVTATDIAPRATALAMGAASSAPPIKEIDVDLSPGGLENVSMTMRLAGDKLSVVIRAASSHTLSSIEGARDAIADRMAAIGQPLDSLIVKQAGVNADGNGSSADSGSGGEQRSAQGDGERGGSDDAGLSRRGAHRDRSF